MKLIKTLGAGIALIIILLIVAIVGVWAFQWIDVMSYTATGSETLSPAGASAGHALVVYDPGVTGAAKNTARKIAVDLQSKGYTVDLAGIRSAAAGNVSGDDPVIVGGPTFCGSLGSAARSYIQHLDVPAKTRVGVFATGTIEPESNDSAYMRNFVTTLPDGEHGKIESAVKLVTDVNGNYINKTGVDTQCSVFVAELVQ